MKRITLAAIRAIKTARHQCRLRPQIASLDPAERRDYQAAMDDTSLTLRAISSVLADRGIQVSETTLHHHRHRRCGECFGVPK